MKLDRTEEHTAFLNWLIDTLKSEKIDLLLIAGDVFDVPNPPHQSLELFYQFLHRVSVETRTETLIIAGNHDSGVLLEAPKALLRTHRVHIWGKLSHNPDDHWITIRKNQSDELDVCAIPFFRSFELMPNGEGDAIEALKKYVHQEKSRPTLLLFHHLAGVYEAAGSEQVVSLSGVDSIPVELIREFDYVALGHIHKPQKISDKAFYSGSPIPLRFSETLGKSVMIIDGTEIKKLPIPVFRPLHLVKAELANWKEKIRALPQFSGLTPMVELQLSLPEPQIGITDEIRELCTEKGMELLSFIPIYGATTEKRKKKENLFELSPVELFNDYYSFRYPGENLSDELKDDFKSLLQRAKDAPP